MRMVYNVKSLANFIPKNTVKMFDSLEIVHRNRTANVVAKEINDLQPGETFGMFVRLQNCAIMIHRQSDAKSDSNNMIVATFPGRMHPNVVYKNPSDVEVIEKVSIQMIYFKFCYVKELILFYLYPSIHSSTIRCKRLK